MVILNHPTQANLGVLILNIKVHEHAFHYEKQTPQGTQKVTQSSHFGNKKAEILHPFHTHFISRTCYRAIICLNKHGIVLYILTHCRNTQNKTKIFKASWRNCYAVK